MRRTFIFFSGPKVVKLTLIARVRLLVLSCACVILRVLVFDMLVRVTAKLIASNCVSLSVTP